MSQIQGAELHRPPSTDDVRWVQVVLRNGHGVSRHGGGVDRGGPLAKVIKDKGRRDGSPDEQKHGELREVNTGFHGDYVFACFRWMDA